LAPPDGQKFPGDAEIVLSWQSVGQLPANVYYVITVAYSHFEETWYDETPWTKNTSWTLSEHRYLLDLSDDGQFRWSVQVMRQPAGIAVSPMSEVRTLIWRTEGGGPSKPPTPPPPDPGPS
jgi:hypothetical protein